MSAVLEMPTTRKNRCAWCYAPTHQGDTCVNCEDMFYHTPEEIRTNEQRKYNLRAFVLDVAVSVLISYAITIAFGLVLLRVLKLFKF